MIKPEHEGRRIEYTARNGKKSYGTIKSVSLGTKFADCKIDGQKRETFYIPFDMIRVLSPDEEAAVDLTR